MVETNIQEKLNSYKALPTLFMLKRGQPSRASLFCRKRVFNIKRKSCCNISPLAQSGPGKNIEASLYIYYDTKNFKKIIMMVMEFSFSFLESFIIWSRSAAAKDILAFEQQV